MKDFHPLRIAEVRRETSDAISVVLEVPAELAEAYRFQPGQHVNVRAVIGGEEQRRSYSICGPASWASGSGIRIAIKAIADGRFSHWAGATLKAGDMLDVMPPAGRFVLPPGDGAPRHLAAFAAGAGITPIIAMIRHALETEPATSFTLVYGNRSLDSILFREELEDLKDRHLGRFTLLHVLSRNEESSTPLLEGRISADKVKALAASLLAPGRLAHVFLCGPGSMIKETRTALLELGLPREQVHHEFFAAGGGAFRGKDAPAKAVAVSAPEASTAAAAGTEAVAVLDGIRHRFMVPPGGRIVDAALAAGIRVPYACKGGMCCTCRARLVEGEAEMTVNYSLEPWEVERGFILTCQAVPKSERVVVDYDAM